MSLRIFHIVFVMVCVALSLWVGVWGIHNYMVERSMGSLWLALVFLVGGVVLVLYGKKAFAKLRDLP
jgi:hypothetical protein